MIEVALDSSKKYAPVNLGRVLILGLGKTGQAVSKYCAELVGSRIESLTIAAGAFSEPAQSFVDELPHEGITTLFDTYSFEESYDVCIASPGISQFSEFYQAALAHCTELISEVEFAWRESNADSEWVAITGTNGKTTTTALAAHLLSSCGKRAQAVGNIGDTCLEAVASGAVDCYVAEVSSYQLASTSRFAPDVAVLLNITPDHIKWHKSFEAYCEAKRKVFANCAAGSTIVLDATNDIVREYVKELRKQFDVLDSSVVVPLGTKEGIASSMIERCGASSAAYSDKGTLVVERSGKRVELINQAELNIKGEHNVLNALAAAAATLSLVDESCHGDLRKALASFQPLEHRIEPCGTVKGVRCYNDSKATNVDATLKALAAFGKEKPFVLLGGDDKGTDLTELVRAANKHTLGVVCFGAAGPRFFEAFSEAEVPVFSAEHLEDAFNTALEQVKPGDIVILSPACASFDEFSCFEERGEVFKNLVVKRASERGA